MSKIIPTILVVSLVSAIVVLLVILLRDGGDDGSEKAVSATPTPPAVVLPPEDFGPHPASPPGAGPQLLPASRVMFCVPMTTADGRVVIAPEGARPRYRAGACERIPAIEGSIAVINADGSEGEVRFEQAAAAEDIERVVWVPARDLLFGEPTVLTGRFLLSPQQEDDEFGRMAVIVGLDPDGAELLASIANANANMPMTIFIDGKKLRMSDGALWVTTLSPGFAGPFAFEGLAPDVALALSDQLTSLLDDE
jgi:hypothetical protein